MGREYVLSAFTPSNFHSLLYYCVDIIKKYSNFVAFPIYLNNQKINTLGGKYIDSYFLLKIFALLVVWAQALWLQDKNTISEEQYLQFYQYQAKAYDKPRYRYVSLFTYAVISISYYLFV